MKLTMPMILSVSAMLLYIHCCHGINNPAAFDCGSVNDKALISKGSMEPQRITPGINMTLVASGHLLEPVTGGNYSIAITFDGFSIVEHSGPICGEDSFDLPFGLGKVHMDLIECPAAPGPFHLVAILPVSSAPPKGTFGAKVQAFDSANNQLMCYTLSYSD